MTPTETIAVTRAPGHRLGIAALVLAIATPVTAVIGWIWAASTPGMGALAIAVIALLVVGSIAAIAIIVGLISLGVSKPNSNAKVALLLVAASAMVLLMLIFPPTLWFA